MPHHGSGTIPGSVQALNDIAFFIEHAAVFIRQQAAFGAQVARPNLDAIEWGFGQRCKVGVGFYFGVAVDAVISAIAAMEVLVFSVDGKLVKSCHSCFETGGVDPHFIGKFCERISLG